MLRHAACARAWGAWMTGEACWGMLQAPACCGMLQAPGRGARGALMAGLVLQKKRRETTNRLLLRLFVFEVPCWLDLTCLMRFIVF